jgi:hypothetical protein
MKDTILRNKLKFLTVKYVELFEDYESISCGHIEKNYFAF